MAAVITIPNNRDGYIEVVRMVLENGELVDSRAGLTREVMSATIVLEDPTDSLPVGIGRNLNTAIAAVEAASLIGGVSDPELLCAIAPNFKQFLDNGVFHGAYGPRTRDQYPNAERRLRETPDTRQAVVSIWDPKKDGPIDGLRDYPCTLSHAFYIRKNKLVMCTVMRSNDLLLGWSYDCHMFTQVQLTMCHVLGLEPGPYIHHTHSLHLYSRDWEAAEELVSNNVQSEKSSDLPIGFSGGTWTMAADRARSVLLGLEPQTTSEVWYKSQIVKKLSTA